MINILGEKDARGVNVKAILVFVYVFCFFCVVCLVCFFVLGFVGGLFFKLNIVHLWPMVTGGQY